MSTAIINIKTEAEVKQKAQVIAKELGFSLSSLLNAYLKHLIKTKTVHFSLSDGEVPSKYLLNSMERAEVQLKKGDTSPTFDNPDDLVSFLHTRVK